MCRAWWLMVAAVLASAIADEASDPEGLLEPVAGKSQTFSHNPHFQGHKLC